MTTFVTANLTAVVMLAHSLLGCCAHHDHAAGHRHLHGLHVAGHAEDRAEEETDCPCGRRTPAESTGQPAAGADDHVPHHHGLCVEDSCAYVKSPCIAVDLDLDQLSSPWFAPADRNAATTEATRTLPAVDPAPPASALAVRAQSSVWLL